MQKCATIWLQMKRTITEYSLTTSAQLDYNIQKERTLQLVLSMRGETVKSIPPIQQNSMKNGYDENNNYNKSNETKYEVQLHHKHQQVEREHAQLHAAHQARHQ